MMPPSLHSPPVRHSLFSPTQQGTPKAPVPEVSMLGVLLIAWISAGIGLGLERGISPYLPFRPSFPSIAAKLYVSSLACGCALLGIGGYFLVLRKIEREERKGMQKKEEALIKEAEILSQSWEKSRKSLDSARAWLNKYAQWVARAEPFSAQMKTQVEELRRQAVAVERAIHFGSELQKARRAGRTVPCYTAVRRDASNRTQEREAREKEIAKT